MKGEKSLPDLSDVAQAHADAGRFAEAESAMRELIARIAPEDHLRRWIEFAQLGGILNMLERADEGTEMYRRALEEAQQLPSSNELGVARYMLANQYRLFGDPRDALEIAEPIPAGVGHVQCLLHTVVADSLWKLERHAEARAAAKNAIAASPTDDRRTQLAEELNHILTA
jgi:tetratricopeptide (TPR) repeat protein